MPKVVFALKVGVTPARIAGVKKPWMAIDFPILEASIHGLTAPASMPRPFLLIIGYSLLADRSTAAPKPISKINYPHSGFYCSCPIENVLACNWNRIQGE